MFVKSKREFHPPPHQHTTTNIVFYKLHDRIEETMTLHGLDSAEAVQAFLSKNKNSLVCFSATWCGPCKASKPALEQMAAKYEADVTMDVTFGIVYEDKLGEAIHNYRVRAFPTYVLFQSQSETGRVEGANLPGIDELIQNSNCQALTGGETLGGSSGAAPLSMEEARAKRLAKLGAATTAAPTTSPAPAETPPAEKEEVKDVEMKEAAAPADQKEENQDVEMKDSDEGEATKVDPTTNLDAGMIKTLTESMGFPLIRAQKGLLNGNGGTVEGAVDWLMQHQDDADIDDPIPLQEEGAAAGGGVVAQSYKCNDCGKILSSMANLELHANKTGHSDFEESTQCIIALTPEEKAAKLEQIKKLLKQKRNQREAQEKEEAKDREKQRRFMGKEMSKTREELEKEQRKREAQMRKRQKHDERRERERIRAELEKDKAERKANKGKLHSSLGVDGYNPSAIQYDVGAGAEHDADAHAEHKKHKMKASVTKIDDYIKKVSSYRAGGDGGKCLKILLAYVGNVADKPGEDKFKSINTENKVYKTKVKPFVGAKNLLLAVGFSPNESGTAMVLNEDASAQLLTDTKAKLQAAYTAYNS